MFKHFSNSNNYLKMSQFKNTTGGTGRQLGYFSRKYFFNGRFDSMAPVTKYLLIGFTGIYIFKFIMPERQYVKEFFYHRLALSHGKFHTLITSHFVSVNFLDFAINVFILGYLGSQVEFMFGSAVFRKLILASIGAGAVLLLAMHNRDDSFIKSDAILRGVMMYMILSQPNTVFMLFPFPISIKAKTLGFILVGLDLFTRKFVNFGGTLGAYMVVSGLI
jgi:membrane associated rhomboid family serine protease